MAKVSLEFTAQNAQQNASQPQTTISRVPWRPVALLPAGTNWLSPIETSSATWIPQGLACPLGVLFASSKT